MRDKDAAGAFAHQLTDLGARVHVEQAAQWDTEYPPFDDEWA